MKFATSYMGKVYTNPVKYAELVKETAKIVRNLKKTLKFDAIAFRGTSGAALAYPVSVLTNIPLICVRKTKEKSHGYNIEGSRKFEVKRYIIIDDFIETGSTIRNIINAIDKENGLKGWKPKDDYYRDHHVPCVGIVLYNESPYDRQRSWNDIPIFKVVIPRKKKKR